MKFEDLEVGMNESIEKTISETDVYLYAGISCDTNPIHLNEEYAKKTMFKKRIAHGMLTAGLISAVLGTKFPGPGTIYLGQELKFMGPVYIGDTIKANVELHEKIEGKNILKLKTICTNQQGEVVLSGTATVMFKN